MAKDKLVKNTDEQPAGNPVYTEAPNAWKSPAGDGVPENGTTPVANQQPAVTTPVTGNEQVVATPTATPQPQPGTTPTVNGAVNPDNYTFTADQLAAMEKNPEEGVTPQFSAKGNHLTDWGNTSLEDYMANEGKDKPIRDIIFDYMTWSQENGKPYNPWAINDIINKTTDMSLTPAQEAEARKKQERKERWDKVGNFLLHLGNVIGNVGSSNYGSVKLEDPVQWTERQRMLKEKTDQQRRLNNQSIWAQMQKERADQRAHEIAKQNAEHQARMEKIARDKAEAYARSLETKGQNETRLTDSKIDLNKATGQARITSAGKNGRSGGGGKNNDGIVKISKKTDKYGNQTTTKTWQEPAHNRSGNSAFGNRSRSGNTKRNRAFGPR